MNRNTPCYTIIAGVNGSGKSTFTGATKKQDANMGVIVNVDKAAMDEKMTPLEAGKYAIEKIEDCLDKRVSFTQETTLSGKKIVNIAKKAKENGFCVRMNYIAIGSPQEAKRRIAERVKNGGHDIRDEDVERRYENINYDVIKMLPYCDEATFYDNQNGFEIVGERRNGEITQIGDYKPAWFEALKKEANSLRTQVLNGKEKNGNKSGASESHQS